MRLSKLSFVVVGVVCAAGSNAAAAIHSFPSDDSTVVGSLGFIDATRIGHFWTADRGDSVEELFADPLSAVTQAIFDFSVPSNVLNSVPVEWDVLINGVAVGDFSIAVGFTGDVHLDLSFAAVPNAGGNYLVRFEVTNVVPPGDGSHTLAYAGAFEHSVELSTQDSDNDGIPDDEDACPDSDLSETVVIDGCDSGVANLLFEDGCTMADLIAECADGAVNHGQFVSCVARLTNEWNRAGLITGREEGRIQSCTARSDIPGDLDGDGAVGVADLVILLGAWGPCRAHPDACPADVDLDDIVGITDLLILLGNWG